MKRRSILVLVVLTAALAVGFMTARQVHAQACGTFFVPGGCLAGDTI